jgi:uncharacterized membrane protein
MERAKQGSESSSQLRERAARQTVMNRTAERLVMGQWVLVAGLFAAAALVWPSAPDSIPVHWSLDGQPDRYAGKLEGLLALPATALVLALLLKFLPRIDPMRERYTEFAAAYALTGLAIITVLAAVYGVILLWIYGTPVNVGLVVGSLVGLLLAVLGGIMGQLRRNWFVGIRTPWTLSSEHSWSATHRAGRWVFVVMGLSIAMAGVLQMPWALYIALAICLAGILGLVAYSYVTWRDDPSRHVA